MNKKGNLLKIAQGEEAGTLISWFEDSVIWRFENYNLDT
jgi:hypothetical protein